MTAESELAGFIAKFAPEMQCRIRGCRAKLEARFPDAVQMVYDNYNFLVIGFGPTRRASDAILSLAAHARGVNLCFLQRGPELPDPTSILRGSGKVVRTVALDSPDDLDRPDVGALIEVALGLAATPMDASDNGDLVIKSVSGKQPAPLTRHGPCARHRMRGPAEGYSWGRKGFLLRDGSGDARASRQMRELAAGEVQTRMDGTRATARP